MAKIILSLPKPHPKQYEIKHADAKRKVICAGRRAGKTTLAAMIAIEGALKRRRILEATPTQEQSEAFWEKCKEYAAPLLVQGYVTKNETRHLLDFPGGGRIRAKTAWDADTMRGDYADFLILDEFPLMHPDAWDKVGAPMLLDNDGDAMFIGTPKRKNHFHSLYVRALQDGERWRAWHFTSHDNPHLSRTALAEITADLSREAYRQEIMAEFLESEGAVFRNLAACMGAFKNVRPEDHRVETEGKNGQEHKWHRIVAGVDWGKKRDFTAISIGCADCMVELAIDRFNRIDYHFQRKRLVALAKKWGVQTLWPEANSMGEPIIEQLMRDPELADTNIVPFMTTGATKPPLIENLALSFEREEMQWLDDPIWTAELEAYEVKYSPTTGRPSYSAPEGVHDDTVMARALCRRAIGRVMIGSPFAMW